jgi:P-type Mg2+ transporter
VVSAALILLVVRSRRPFFRSNPSRRLLLATLGVVVATVALPYLPFASILGFTPLPLKYLGVAAAIVTLYIISGELAKQLFYRQFDRAPSPAG